MSSQFPVLESGSHYPGALVPSRLDNSWNGYHVNVQTVSGTPIHAPTPQSTFLQILMKLVLKRWKLLTAWCILSAIIAAAVIVVFGKPVWRAEGRMFYDAGFGKIARKLVPGGNTMTIFQKINTPDMLDRVNSDLKMNLSDRELKNTFKLEVLRSNELIAVAIDNPDPDLARRAVERLMELSIQDHEKAHRKELEEALKVKREEQKRVGEELSDLERKYNADLRKLGISSKNVEEELLNAVKDEQLVEAELDKNKRLLESLPKQIQEIEREIKTLSEQPMSLQNQQMLDLIESNITELRVKIGEDKANLKAAEEQFAMFIKLTKSEKNIIPKSEFTEAQAKVESLTNSLKLREARLEDSLKKRESVKSSDSVQMQNLLSLKTTKQGELTATRDSEIPKLKELINAKKNRISELQQIQDQMMPRVKEIESKKNSNAILESIIGENVTLLTNDQQELKIHEPAKVGSKPVSSNNMKLAAGVFAVMMMLFLGFVLINDLPRYSQSGEVTARRLNLPVLANYKEGAASAAGLTRGAASPAVIKLATQLRNRFHEHGSIVLFTPATADIQIENMAAEVAGNLAQSIGRILIFDARGPQAGFTTVPGWIGGAGVEVGRYVEEYLQGVSDKPAQSFVATQIPGVEYSRSDLGRHMSNMIGTYRIQRLIEDMREQHSMILMLAPAVPAKSPEDNQLLNLVDGSILVLDDERNPAGAQAYVETLRSSENPPLGTVIFEQRDTGW